MTFIWKPIFLIYIPFFNTVFRTTPLRPAELGICAVGALGHYTDYGIEKTIPAQQTSLKITHNSIDSGMLHLLMTMYMIEFGLLMKIIRYRGL
mgnify:CR=1 FL=1